MVGIIDLAALSIRLPQPIATLLGDGVLCSCNQLQLLSIDRIGGDAEAMRNVRCQGDRNHSRPQARHLKSCADHYGRK